MVWTLSVKLLLGWSLGVRSLVLAAPMDQRHDDWHGYNDLYYLLPPLDQSRDWQSLGYVAP